jgi:type II secretory pathway component PulF
MALETAADLLPEAQRRWMNETAVQGIHKHREFNNLLAESGFIPPFLVTMVRIGEQAGRLEDVLEKAALAYEHELEIELT